MGDNHDGQLGDGTHNATNRPELIVSSNVTAVASGAFHSLFLKSDGSLWAMGGSFSNLPEQIVSSNVTAIAAGNGHSLFLKSDGSLWGMGDNHDGQLGVGTYYNTNQPQLIVSSNVTVIAAGDLHSLFVKSDGSLWAMGYNNFGQLGDGTYNKTNFPEQIVSSNVMAIAANGGYLTIPGENVNYSHSLFVKNDGSLWAMGYNNFGQLGDGTYNNTNRPEEIVAGGVIAIAAGDGHSLFVKSDGSLWAMGANSYGALGGGFSGGTNLPEQIVAGPTGYNQISIQLLDDSDVLLSFAGIQGANYALDWSSGLSPANWQPQATNPAGSNGILLLTNTPDPTINNFWRVRSVQ